VVVGIEERIIEIEEEEVLIVEKIKDIKDLSQEKDQDLNKGDLENIRMIMVRMKIRKKKEAHKILKERKKNISLVIDFKYFIILYFFKKL
jgi:hypothetical protein